MSVGTAGEMTKEVAPKGRSIPGSEQVTQQPVPGDDIILTLDRSIQFAVEEALVGRVSELGAKSGTVVVMEQQEFEDWLDLQAEGSPALEGRKLFKKLQCAACHTGDAKARGPNLAGLYGRSVLLRDGGRAPADAAYVRDRLSSLAGDTDLSKYIL